MPHNRFFINYKRNNCAVQAVGKNTFSKFPKLIAEILKLPDSAVYIGHCFRRSSASFLVDGGGDLLTLKNHNGWKYFPRCRKRDDGMPIMFFSHYIFVTEHFKKFLR